MRYAIREEWLPSTQQRCRVREATVIDISRYKSKNVEMKLRDSPMLICSQIAFSSFIAKSKSRTSYTPSTIPDGWSNIQWTLISERLFLRRRFFTARAVFISHIPASYGSEASSLSSLSRPLFSYNLATKSAKLCEILGRSFSSIRSTTSTFKWKHQCASSLNPWICRALWNFPKVQPISAAAYRKSKHLA